MNSLRMRSLQRRAVRQLRRPGEAAVPAEAVGEEHEEAAETGAADAELQLIQELQQKYAANSAVHYRGDVIEIERDEAIQIPIGYNPWSREEHIYDSFVVYQDDGLQYPLELGVHDYDAETGMLTINPPYYGIAEMDDYEIDLSHLSGSYLMKEEGNAWGNSAPVLSGRLCGYGNRRAAGSSGDYGD